MSRHTTRAIGALHPRIGGTGRPASALSPAADTRLAAADVIAQLEAQLMGAAPTAVLVFCSPAHDETALAVAIGERYRSAQVVGCTTAGEFSEREGSVGGVAAIALPATTARAAHAVLVGLDRGVDAGIGEALARLGNDIGVEPRALDPARWVALVLHDGMGAGGRTVGEALAAAAPQLAFAVGAAGDDLQFRGARVFRDGASASGGAVVVLLDMCVPFTIVHGRGDAGGATDLATLAARVSRGVDVQRIVATDFVGETRSAIGRAIAEVGGRAGGVIAFHCVLRRLALDATGAHAAFRDAFATAPTAGFHGYGECSGRHGHGGCTALVFA